MPRRNPLTEVKEKVPSLAQRPDSVAEGKRDRSWDEKNPRFGFRIRVEDAERLAGKAAALQVSRDALGRALMQAALDALDRGWLDVEAYEERRETKDRLGRFRVTIRRFVQPSWTIERSEDTDD
jgi:hypothetical protein